jgi:hypothetical protein
MMQKEAFETVHLWVKASLLKKMVVTRIRTKNFNGH